MTRVHVNSFCPRGSGGTLETWQQGMAKLLGSLKFWSLETNARAGYRWITSGAPALPDTLALLSLVWAD